MSDSIPACVTIIQGVDLPDTLLFYIYSKLCGKLVVRKTYIQVIADWQRAAINVECTGEGPRVPAHLDPGRSILA